MNKSNTDRLRLALAAFQGETAETSADAEIIALTRAAFWTGRYSDHVAVVAAKLGRPLTSDEVDLVSDVLDGLL